MAEQPVEWMAKMGKAEHLHLFYNALTVVVISRKEDAVSPFADCCAAIQNMLITEDPQYRIGQVSLHFTAFHVGILGVQ